MSKQQRLSDKLSAEFAPHFLHVENESHMHSSGRGAESHFKVVVVSDKFEGLRKVARHRLIYSLFEQELSNGIHALALHTYTREEWIALSETVPVSTNGLGLGQ